MDHDPKLTSLYRQISQNPEDLASRRMLARAYMKDKLYLHAFRLYQEIRVRAGSDPDQEQALAHIWEEWGDHSMARQHAERALELNPNSEDSLELLERIHAALRDSIEEYPAATDVKSPAAPPKVRYPTVVHLSLPESSPAADPTNFQGDSREWVERRKPTTPMGRTVSTGGMQALSLATAEVVSTPERGPQQQFPLQVEFSAAKKLLDILSDDRRLDLPGLLDLHRGFSQAESGNHFTAQAAGKSQLLHPRTSSEPMHDPFNSTAFVLATPFKRVPTLAIRELLELTPAWNGTRLSQSTIVPLGLTAGGGLRESGPAFPLTVVAFLFAMATAPAASRRRPPSPPGRSTHSVPRRRRADDSQEGKSSKGHPERKHDAHQIRKKESRTTKLDECPAMDGFTKTANLHAAPEDLKNGNRKISPTHVLACIVFAFALVSLLKRREQ